MTELRGHEKAVRAIALPAGSSQLYTGGQDESVRVWNCVTGQCTSVVQMGGDVGALLSESGWLFVGLPNEVKTWNMQSAAQHSLTGPKGQVHSMAINGDMLFAGTHDGNILLWKFNPSSNGFDPVVSLTGHTLPVLVLQVASNRLYSGSMDQSIRVWDLSSGQCVQTLLGHTGIVMGLLCWEQYLLSCSLDGTIKVWGMSSSGQLDNTYTHPETDETPNGASDAPRDVSGKRHSCTRLFDFATSTLELCSLYRADQGRPKADQGRSLCLFNGQGALSLSGTIDGASKPVLLCAYNDNTVRLYDLPTFNERGALFTLEEVRALHVGPGGIMFSGDSHGDVKVWRWTTPLAGVVP
eukprot:SM000114S24127  [mRNA]  locus=s114:97755:100785:+ [translate_table: standard]